MAEDLAPSRKPFVWIDLRWLSLGVLDGFNGARPQHAAADQFSYTSGRVEGKSARELGRTVDQVLEKYKMPYRAAHFRPARPAGLPPNRKP